MDLSVNVNSPYRSRKLGMGKVKSFSNQKPFVITVFFLIIDK